MRRNLLAGRFALVIGLVLAGAASAAAPPDPAAFVATIYAHGAEPKVWLQWLRAATRRPWMSRGLAALWAKVDAIDKANPGDEGTLDFDVATNSQGMSVKDFHVRAESRAGARAVVLATLIADDWARSSPKENEIRYDLVLEDGRWKIDDIRSTAGAEPWSLRALLKDAIKR